MSAAEETGLAEGAAERDDRVCRLPGCGGPRSGVCINNLSFADCPDIIEGEANPENSLLATTARGSEAEDTEKLPGGHALGARACDTLLLQRGGVVVGLVAGPDVGKTTLIATAYELLTRRRMKDFSFAGSETLRGYEERCHLARLASKNSEADTPRTPGKDQLSFTHLSLVSRVGRHDLVFSDRSGEHFQRVLNRPGQITEFEEIRRADVILILVDLLQLVHQVHSQTATMRKWFMAMDQHGMLGQSRVFLVGTKADMAIPTPRKNHAAKALRELAADLSGRSQGRIQVKPRIIACRPRKGSSAVGEGIEALFSEILAPVAKVPLPPVAVWPESPTELDLLMRGYRAKTR